MGRGGRGRGREGGGGGGRGREGEKEGEGERGEGREREREREREHCIHEQCSNECEVLLCVPIGILGDHLLIRIIHMCFTNTDV